MFTAIVTYLSSKVSTIIPWLVGILGLISAYFGVRQAGKNAAYAEIAQKDSKQNAEAMQIIQNNATLSDDDVSRILREQFGSR